LCTIRRRPIEGCQAGGGGGEASEASEQEDRECEKQFAFLREEEERVRRISVSDDNGVEWLSHANKCGWRSLPLASLELKRRASEKKWPEASSWCERRQLNKGYVLREKGKPGPTPARAEERTSSRFYQLKSGRVLEKHGEQTRRPLLVVRPGEQQCHSPDERPLLQALLQVARPTGRDVREKTNLGKQKWRVNT